MKMNTPSLIWGFTEIDDWFFSDKWNYYQRVQGKVVVYVGRMLFGQYNIQLYLKGGLSDYCALERRSENPHELFEVGEEWLNEFEDGDVEKLRTHYYAPFNPEGWWQTVYWPNPER